MESPDRMERRAPRRRGPAADRPSAGTPRASTDWPLTGRDEELRGAIGAQRTAGGVLLAGPAGVGKTRLAREVLRDAAHRGRRVRWATATAAARELPLGAFSALVTDATRPVDASLLARVASAIRDRADVLVVDDAHLLDDLSAVVLHRLALERAVGLVVVVRAGEPMPDAVTALWKDGLLERSEVAPLDESSVGTLLRAVLGGPVDAVSRRELHAMTLGNLLWLRHLLYGERMGGRLVERAGHWRWTGEPEITPALADLIHSSIGQLAPDHRHVLEMMAFGQPLDTELLEQLTDPAAVTEVARRGLIEMDLAGRRGELRLAHPLYREAVRARTSALRARQLCGRLAEALSRGGAPAVDPLRRAVLVLDGDRPADPVLLTEAATAAATAGDRALAERLLRGACESGGGFAPRLALGMSLAWGSGVASEHELAEHELAEHELAEAARIAEDDGQRVRVACGRAIVGLFRGTSADRVRPLLGAAERFAGTEDGPAEQVRAVRAMCAAAGNRLREAAELAAPILAAPGASPFAQVWAGYAVLLEHSAAGWAEPVDTLAQRLIATAVSSPETAFLRFDLAYLRASGLGLAGRLDRATATAGWLRDLPGGHAAAARDAIDGRLALCRGQVRSAARLLRGGQTRAGTAAGWPVVSETAIALALGMAGDAGGAREALRRVEELRHPGVRHHEPEHALARAWTSAAEGSIAQAREQATHAAELAEASGQYAVEVFARHSCVCLGDPGHVDRLAALAGSVGGPRAAAASAHAAALAADDPDALLAVSAQLAGYELLLPAADAAAQAAAVFRSRGKAAQAAFAVARAGGLAERCEGARTPALLAGMAPLPISVREREVATLAATGLTNLEIAQRLHVSVRTVEGHIYRACSRLGLTDRTALAALITEGPTSVDRAASHG
ncbi:MAG TPA: LuxR C-terminal-related transcriptional regulator [Pseudonocardia sp.]|nr:LuxR C-terminal-related transcriptional regulator [Pseudonocardia sp.]